MKRNILLTIKYDGTSFFGWQKQKEFPSIQEEVEKGLEKIFSEKIQIEGTGRTDRGVHAYEQCATFTAEEGIPVEKIPFALTNLMPSAIEIVDAREVPEDFHARFSATGKTYTYKILTSLKGLPKEKGKTMAFPGENIRPSIFLRNYAYFVKESLDIDAMKAAAKDIEGTHDFESFQAMGSDVKETTVRTIYSIKINEEEVVNGVLDDKDVGKLITIDVTGDGFLYNMVRIIAGTLVDVGVGKINKKDMKEIVARKQRNLAGHTAPPWGLYLKKVFFTEEVKDD